jgi:ABC-2 type transport system permease protein
MLAAVFVAIGIFASAITKNQIVAFIVAIVLCFFCYQGFEMLYMMLPTLFVKSLGIYHHYESVSRGVIDTRDVLYFLSVIFLFLMFTYTVLQSRKWQK